MLFELMACADLKRDGIGIVEPEGGLKANGFTAAAAVGVAVDVKKATLLKSSVIYAGSENKRMLMLR